MAANLDFLDEVVRTSSKAMKAMNNYSLSFHSQAEVNQTEVKHKANQLDHLSITISEVAAGRYNRPTNKLR